MIRIGACGLVLFLCLLVSPAIQPVAAQFDPVGEILRPEGTNNFRAVAEKDGYVYVGNNGGGFYVFDARAVSVDGPFRTINSHVSRQDRYALGLLRVGNVLYVTGDGLQVMDITNPATPVAGIKLQGGDPRVMSRSGDFLFATGPDTLNVYSISNPSNPAVVSNTATLGTDHGFAIASFGEHIYVSAYRSGAYFLRVFAWPEQGATVLPVREIAMDDLPYHLFVKGNYLVATGDGATVWSLADPELPVKVDEEIASGRAALFWGTKLVTNGRVHSWHGPMLELFSSYAPGGTQGDGAPHTAAGNADFIFIPQSARVLILATPPTLIFPQYVNGSYGSLPNRTRLILKNTGTQTATGVARFRTGAGAANPVPIGGVNKSEVEYSIPAGGTQQITTGGTGALSIGPLEVRSDSAGDTSIKGTEIFDLLGFSTSVQNAPLAKVHKAFVSRTTAENTGVAMYNPSFNVSCQVEARLFDKNGALVAGPVTLTLAARNQTAVFVTDASLFATYLASVPGDFEGTLQLTVSAGGPIAVVSLLQKSNNALLAVPVESQTVAGP